jgi:hypothetical protein
VGILDALSDTEYWLHWTQHFGPISGYEAKLEQPRERYLMTAFAIAATWARRRRPARSRAWTSRWPSSTNDTSRKRP